MTTTLLFLALLAAINPVRVHAVRPEPVTTGALGYAFVTVIALGAVFALLADPLLDLVDVSVSTGRIAAGVALVVVAARDVFGAVPKPEPALAGDRAGVVPLAFPTVMNPATALLVVSAASDRGVGVAVLVLTLTLTIALVVTRGPRLPALRTLNATAGVGGVAIAVLVVMDGVLAI